MIFTVRTYYAKGVGFFPSWELNLESRLMVKTINYVKMS